jgi:bacillithiol biosynthesis cysteine-adding enzyme BshC
VAGKDPPKYLYSAENLEDVAGRLDTFPHDQEKTAAVLRRQNSVYGSSSRTFENIDKLSDPRTVCVFSGQQAGFLGGPLFTIIKAIAVVKATESYTKRLDRPVIPVFWIAGDDHDFEEVNHTYILNRETEPCEMAYDAPPDLEHSVADVVFSDAEELGRVKQCVKKCLGETDFTPALYELIDRAYTPEDTFVTAFGKLMAGLMKDSGLILFSPHDAEIKRHAVPFFTDILDKQEALFNVVSERNREIAGLGYHIQVAKKDNATHLMCNLNGRKPIMREGQSFAVGERVFSYNELVHLISDQPERFSPDVMTRPVFQSYLFPTVSQKGGPAEIAYLAQVDPIFGLFGLPAPYYEARPSATIVETRFEKLLAKHEIAFEDLTGDIEQVINRVLSKTFPKDLELHFETLRDDVEGRFEQFIQDSLKFDPSLKAVARQIYGKIDFNLKAFESKVFAAHKKHSKNARDRMYRLWHALYPHRGLQERCLNVTYFISRYGPEFVSYLTEVMDSEETAHQLIYLSEMRT